MNFKDELKEKWKFIVLLVVLSIVGPMVFLAWFLNRREIIRHIFDQNAGGAKPAIEWEEEKYWGNSGRSER